MFLSAVKPYVTAIIIAVIAVQYAFALFCLLKLAYFDVPKRDYVLWNLFILLVFFIGGAVFLVYFYKNPDRRIRSDTAMPEASEAEPKNVESEPAEPPDGERAPDGDADL